MFILCEKIIETVKATKRIKKIEDKLSKSDECYEIFNYFDFWDNCICDSVINKVRKSGHTVVLLDSNDVCGDIAIKIIK